MSATTASAVQRSEAAFAPTHWSVVLSAGNGEGTDASAALQQLCRAYWYPVYAHVRRRGRSAHDAEDLTQAFFERLLNSDFLSRADRQRGRFRSFLLTALNHFLADERDRSNAQKRGGGSPLLALNLEAAETRFQAEPADPDTPEKAYDRQWARALLSKVILRLQREYEAEGRGSLFVHLKSSLAQARAAVPYGELSDPLAMSEGALRVAVHRLRQRYRDLLREEIAGTVANPAETEEELRHLFRVLAS